MRAWLNKAPRMMLSSPKTNYLTYEEWTAAGRKIEGIEPVLIKLFHDSDDLYRFDIVLAFGYLGMDESVPLLVELLDPHRQCEGWQAVCIRIDDTWCLHDVAVDSLALLKSPAAVEPLCELLAAIRGNSDLRTGVAGVLALIGDPRARPAIEMAIRISEQELKTAQRKAASEREYLQEALECLPE